jgi:hypothetical protein
LGLFQIGEFSFVLARVGLSSQAITAEQLSLVLKRLEQEFVIVEMDPRRVEQARQAGFPALSGDASQEVVLRAAGLERARLLLITAPVIASARLIVFQARRLNPTRASSPGPRAWSRCAGRATTGWTRWCSPSSRPVWR